MPTPVAYTHPTLAVRHLAAHLRDSARFAAGLAKHLEVGRTHADYVRDRNLAERLAKGAVHPGRALRKLLPVSLRLRAGRG